MTNKVDLILKSDILNVIIKKIEIGNLDENQEEVILTFLEEFLGKTMRFKCHKDIKEMYRGKIMEFLIPLAKAKKTNFNGVKAYDIIARYFKDIKEQITNEVVEIVGEDGSIEVRINLNDD